MAVAQEPDSAQLVMDSLKRELQELRLKEIIMQHALDSTGQSAREDSLRLVRRKMHIDSLKSITPGVPVIVEKDTLFILYASLGGEGPVHRAEDITYKILQLGKSLRTTTDTLTVFDSELTSDVMSGQFVLVPVSDLDGLWAGMSRQELAHVYMGIIDKKIKKMQAEYGLQAKLRGMTWAAALIVLQIVFFVLTARFTGWMRKEIMDGLRGRMKPLVVKGYELLNVRQSKRILLFLTRALQVILVLIQLFISLPLLFSIFPETEKFTWNMINYVQAGEDRRHHLRGEMDAEGHQAPERRDRGRTAEDRQLLSGLGSAYVSHHSDLYHCLYAHRGLAVAAGQ